MVVKDERKRYILLEFVKKVPNKSYFNSNLRKIVSQLSGEIFLAMSGIALIDYSDNRIIVKCNHISRETVEAALTIFPSDNNQHRIMKISGTIKGIDKALEDDLK